MNLIPFVILKSALLSTCLLKFFSKQSVNIILCEVNNTHIVTLFYELRSMVQCYKKNKLKIKIKLTLNPRVLCV